MRNRSLLTAAFLAASVASLTYAAQPQGAQPTPKRKTKAEKKAEKRARTKGTTLVSGDSEANKEKG